MATVVLSPCWYIYGISLDIDDAPIRYVGLSRRPLSYRLEEHIREVARSRLLPLYFWMEKYLDIGFRIFPIELIPSGDEDLLFEREIFWISHYRTSQGDLKSGDSDFNILNVSDGGKSYVRYGDEHHLFGKGHLIAGENNPNYGNGKKISGERNPCFGLFGEDHPAYNYRHTPETREKIAASKRGKHNPGNHTRYHVKRGISSPETCIDCRTLST